MSAGRSPTTRPPRRTPSPARTNARHTPLASRFWRFAARSLDAVPRFLLIFPLALAGALPEDLVGTAVAVVTGAFCALTVVVPIDIALLALRGQTIGRWLVGIRIVRHGDFGRVG